MNLTHWCQMTHICVSKIIIIDSDNGLSPGRWWAIIWTNAIILLTGRSGTNFREILIEIQSFSFIKMHLKILSAKWHLFRLDLNVLIHKLCSKIMLLKLLLHLPRVNELIPRSDKQPFCDKIRKLPRQLWFPAANAGVYHGNQGIVLLKIMTY